MDLIYGIVAPCEEQTVPAVQASPVQAPPVQAPPPLPPRPIRNRSVSPTSALGSKGVPQRRRKSTSPPLYTQQQPCSPRATTSGRSYIDSDNLASMPSSVREIAEEMKRLAANVKVPPVCLEGGSNDSGFANAPLKQDSQPKSQEQRMEQLATEVKKMCKDSTDKAAVVDLLENIKAGPEKIAFEVGLQ